MTKACGVVQPIGRGNFRADHELSRSDERFKSNRIVFERPCKAHAIRELGEAVPPQGPDPGSSQPLDKSSQVQVRGEVGLEDDGTRFLGREAAWTQVLPSARGTGVTSTRMLTQVNVR